MKIIFNSLIILITCTTIIADEKFVSIPVKNGMHPYLVLFVVENPPAELKNRSDLWSTFPICGTIIHPQYVLTQAYRFHKKDFKQIERWSVVGAGKHMVDINLRNTKRTYIEYFKFHPRFNTTAANGYNIYNLGIAKTEEQFSAVSIVITRNVKFSHDTTRYPEQIYPRQIISIVYWLLNTKFKRLEKYQMFLLPYTTRSEQCPNMGKDGYYCFGAVTGGFGDSYPCGPGTMAQGAPVLVNNELHGLLVGYAQGECTTKPSFGKNAPLVATAVLNLKDEDNAYPKLYVARNFMRKYLPNSKYDDFALQGPDIKIYRSYDDESRLSLFRQLTDDSSPSNRTSANRTNVTKIQRTGGTPSKKISYPRCLLDGDSRIANYNNYLLRVLSSVAILLPLGLII